MVDHSYTFKIEIIVFLSIEYINYILFSLIEVCKDLIKNLLWFFPQLFQIPACSRQSVLNIEKQSNRNYVHIFSEFWALWGLFLPLSSSIIIDHELDWTGSPLVGLVLYSEKTVQGCEGVGGRGGGKLHQRHIVHKREERQRERYLNVTWVSHHIITFLVGNMTMGLSYLSVDSW